MSSDDFIQQGKYLIGYRLNIDPKNIFVVWYNKSLQNHKGLFGSIGSDKYLELTYNGDKREVYLDTYIKENNEVINM